MSTAREGALAPAERPDSELGDTDNTEGLSDLELERRRLMARNRAKLIALGISVGVMELRDLASKQKPSHARPKAVHQHRPEPAEPTRRSTRLAGGATGSGEAGEQLLLQLGEDGAAEPQGAERPLHGGRKTSESDEGLTEEQIAARAAQLKVREAARLRELELEGLVDLSRDEAVFVVIGSTGSHYTVRLSDAKRSCQCMDCRIRKRDCKHIRLILGKLQIEDRPSEWYQAVERCFHTAAENASAASPELTEDGRPTAGAGASSTAAAAAAAEPAPEGAADARDETVAPSSPPASGTHDSKAGSGGRRGRQGKAGGRTSAAAGPQKGRGRKRTVAEQEHEPEAAEEVEAGREEGSERVAGGAKAGSAEVALGQGGKAKVAEAEAAEHIQGGRDGRGKAGGGAEEGRRRRRRG